MDEKNKHLPSTEYVRKSNALVTAKYKTSLNENKILALAMTKLDKKMEDSEKVEVVLYSNDIKAVLGSGINVYKEMDNINKSLFSPYVTIADDDGGIASFVMITGTYYKRGKLKITFNADFKPYLLNLKSNYTTMKLSTLAGFKKNSSFRLYEILRMEKYRCDYAVNKGIAAVKYNINELRFMIGEADMGEDNVKSYISKNKGAVDWDYLYNEVAKEKKNVKFSDFKRRVLEPAKKEIEESTDIKFDYELERNGQRFANIIFYVQENESEPSKIDQEALKVGQRVDDFYSEYENHNGLTRKMLREFILEANGSIEKVRRIIELADRQEEIRNYGAWIRDGIKNDYDEPIEIVHGSEKKAEEVNKLDYHNNFIAEKSWANIKGREDFPEFLKYSNYDDISLFEDIIDDVNDRVDMYIKWKKIK